jgi:folate-binding protein YgfZ
LIAAAKQLDAAPLARALKRAASAGIPRFGAEMTKRISRPRPVRVARISYTKGCYIGQEVIARIRTYGQVAKALRGLRFADGECALPRKGDKLVSGEKEVGYVCSAIHSPTLNANIGLGYARRERNQLGTELKARTASGETTATIVEMPFVR